MSSDETSGTGAAFVIQDMDAGATIDAWRARGDHRFDPVRFRFIEALATRAAAHGGDARRILDDKVAKLLAAYGEDLERAGRAHGDTADPSARQEIQSHRGALAELVDHIARQGLPDGDSPAPDDAAPGLPASAELKTLRYFRSTWSRLSADRRLAQSLANVPGNAGPLNSQQLVHRSLTLMRELSPAYLEHFVSYVDALLWLDHRRNGGGALSGADAPRPESHRKPPRGSRSG